MNLRSLPPEPLFGLVEQFRPGEYRRVESVLDRVALLQVGRLRTPVLWSDYHTPSGRAWYQWLMPALASKVELLPVITVSGSGQTPEEPTQPLAEILQGIGAYFSQVELWATPRCSDRDPRLDPAGARFVESLADAIRLVRDSGKRVVLSGDVALNAGWLELLGARGLLRELDALALHGPLTADDLGSGYWPRRADAAAELLTRHGSTAEIWIADTGLANQGADNRAQLRAFTESLTAPVHRFYWQSVQDAVESEEGKDFCLFEPSGEPRLLARLLMEGGVARVRELLSLSHRGGRRNGKGVALITGGAGFIGTNLAARLLSAGRTVRILDNLSRPGTEQNLRWLDQQFGQRLEFRLADVRDRHALREAVADAAEVYHFAAQVAVTTSLVDPIHDFEINGRGTLNLLEELRRIDKPPPLLFTSTNKVYGGLDDLALTVSDTRYDPSEPDIRARGIDESRALSFCSPYGCSKGASDQYVLDFARTYHLPAAVLRMSCIYGPHQFGTEDQGWVAHFTRRALAGKPIVIYGDGRQVRDILFVEDLVDAMLLARDRMEALRGQAFNIGGGPQNSVSLRELLTELARIHGSMPAVSYETWRASDQRYYVSDVSRFHAATGWQPGTSVAAGLEQLHAWLLAQRQTRADRDRTPQERVAL